MSATPGKYFWLKCQLNGMCLDMSNGKVEPGNDTITWEFREAPHQVWFQDPANSVIRSKADENLVLEERDGKVMIETFQRGKEEQQWVVQGERVCRKNQPNRVLHIVNAHKDHAGHLCVEDFNDRPEHKWDAVHLDRSYFLITSMMNGKALDIEGGNASAGANVITWDHHGNDNQQWYEDRFGFIRSKLNGYAISTRDKHAEMAGMDEGDEHCAWVRSAHSIISRFDQDQCLEIEDASDDNCAKLVQGHFQGKDHQRWAFHDLK